MAPVQVWRAPHAVGGEEGDMEASPVGAEGASGDLEEVSARLL